MSERPGPDGPFEEKNDSRPEGNRGASEDGMNPELEKPQSPDKARHDLPEELASLHAEVSRVLSETAAIRVELSALREEFAHSRTENRVLTDLSDRCRKFTERFYEREVLGPILLVLMTIADRARQEIARLQRLMNDRGTRPKLEITLGLQHLIDARRADLIQIEDILASYGAERYQYPGEAFDPRRQECRKLILCQSTESHGHVAHRLSPGYRRNGEILRPERVTVYKHEPEKNERR